MDCCSENYSCKCKKKQDSVIKVYPITFNHDIEYKWDAHYNLIRTNKYRFWNFIFLNLFEQFKRYSNIFFIIVVILNFIPNINSYSKETAIIPIAFVLIVTMIKDGYEDIQRWKNDRVVNNRKVQKYNKESREFKVSSWMDIKVGDMIKLSSNERIPADLLLYHTSDMSGQCFIETIDIDGETNLKQRTIFKPFKDEEKSYEQCFEDYYLEVEAPNREIYKFNGKIMDARTGYCTRLIKHTNLVLRDTLLRNTEEIRGLVIYAGNKTKTLMNNKKPRFKRSLLEEQLNYDILWCIGLLIIVCLMTTIGNIFWVDNLSDINSIIFFSFTLSKVSVPVQRVLIFLSSIIIYQVIIPLPLYITLELVKAHQIFHITRDINLYDEELDKKVEARAYNITEDMGQIKYMFCDKTGTLTQNVMVFKKATIASESYVADDSLKLHLVDNNDNVQPVIENSVKDFLLTAVICNTTIIGRTSKGEKKLVHLNEFDQESEIGGTSQLSYDIFTNFGVDERSTIETLAPIIFDDFEPIPRDLTLPTTEIAESVRSSSLTLVNSLRRQTLDQQRTKITDQELFSLMQSESPDEDALVKFACRNGYKLYQRSLDILTIWSEHENKWIELEILYTIPFDSVRKCMSVIVKSVTSGRITMYCKGADSVMFHKMNLQWDRDRSIIDKVKSDVYVYACDGLRTLVMAKRELSNIEYEEFKKEIDSLESELVGNEETIKCCYDKMERNLTIVGAAGIEDKLQDQVPEILECFKEAGINIWILTGDKRETAINIAYSTRLFSRNEVILEVIGDNHDDMCAELRTHRRTIEESIYKSEKVQDEACIHKEFGLVIDGCSLSILFQFDELNKRELSAEEVLDQKMRSDELKEHFFQITYFCNSVVCCRCTPIQKASVVSMIKSKFNVRTMAVGDGANDVNMIQTADVGIGIGGKEGMQATMASDFAICKFKYLKRLILVHGHWCYDRLARMSLYIFYKDLFIAMVFFLYQIVCGFSMSTAIDQITQIVFHILHTGLPPVIFGIWDKDFDDRILMANPSIYKTGINSKMFRYRDFWRNVADAMWQAICVSVISFLCYQNTEIGMAEYGVVTVSSVIITMFGHILIESKHWNTLIWFSCIGCLLIGFYMEIFILNAVCVVAIDCNSDNPYKVVNYALAQGKTYVVIAAIVSFCLLPRLFFKACLGHTRDSISYEAQHRINAMGVLRYTDNFFNLRQESESAFQFNYKESRYYLGNLEEFKKMECTKCEFKKTFFSDRCQKIHRGRQNRVVPLDI